MNASPRPPSWTAFAMQAGVASAGIAALALAPPAQGGMLLVRLAGDASVVKLARDHDALLVATEPRGTIVRGDRHELFWPLLRAGVLTLAAPAGACGEGR